MSVQFDVLRRVSDLNRYSLSFYEYCSGYGKNYQSNNSNEILANSDKIEHCYYCNADRTKWLIFNWNYAIIFNEKKEIVTIVLEHETNFFNEIKSIEKKLMHYDDMEFIYHDTKYTVSCDNVILCEFGFIVDNLAYFRYDGVKFIE